MTEDNLILKRGSATGTGSFGPDDYDALSDGAVVRPHLPRPVAAISQMRGNSHESGFCWTVRCELSSVHTDISQVHRHKVLPAEHDAWDVQVRHRAWGGRLLHRVRDRDLGTDGGRKRSLYATRGQVRGHASRRGQTDGDGGWIGYPDADRSRPAPRMAMQEMTTGMPRTYLIFGDIAGKLGVLNVECTRCPRRGRYNVASLVAKHGRGGNMTKW